MTFRLPIHRPGWLPLALLSAAIVLAAFSACQSNAPSEAAAALAATLAAATVPAGGLKLTGPYLFDDFAYENHDQMRKNGWLLRDVAGWPGVPGATFSAAHIELVPDPDQPGNTLVQMNAATDGTPEGTRQVQFCHQRKYYEGTYASRVRFTDRPVHGEGRDQLVETFYQIAPQNGNLDPEYSELDFEYLPNGGWGKTGATLFVTSWETFQLEPWQAFNASTPLERSLDGWHTLVLQVADGEVKYYLDGELVDTHGGKNYPNVPMAICYNLWFIRDGLSPVGAERRYAEWVDWVFFEPNTVRTPAEVEQLVQGLREAGTQFNDSVPPHDPPLDSPNNF